jgi:hypothetical protein
MPRRPVPVLAPAARHICHGCGSSVERPAPVYIDGNLTSDFVTHWSDSCRRKAGDKLTTTMPDARISFSKPHTAVMPDWSSERRRSVFVTLAQRELATSNDE